MSFLSNRAKRYRVFVGTQLLVALLLLAAGALISCSAKQVEPGTTAPISTPQPTSTTVPDVTPTATRAPEHPPEKASELAYWSGDVGGELADLRETVLRTRFTVPIVGAPVPTQLNLLPGAPRAYRHGTHQGIDFYYGPNGRLVTTSTEVVAAKTGTVIRADWSYVEPSQSEMRRLLDITKERGYTPEDVLDRLRGRQVWLNHGYGIITRYAHLDRLAPGVVVEEVLQEGHVLGYTGNSGSPDAAAGLGSDVHLHFEIWVGDQYFGQGLKTQDIVPLLKQVFVRRPVSTLGKSP